MTALRGCYYGQLAYGLVLRRTDRARCDVDMTIIAPGNSDHLLTLESIATTFRDASTMAGDRIYSSSLEWSA
jgi:hypothetical protein